MPKYEVLGGTHAAQDGSVYKRGEVVETDRDLEIMFPNAFRRVVAPPLPPALVTTPPGGAPPATPFDDEAKAGAAKTKKAPALVTSVDEKALAARGDDVTVKFPLVASYPEGFRVFKRAELYHVFRADKLEPINPKGLKIDEVAPAVKKYLEG